MIFFARRSRHLGHCSLIIFAASFVRQFDQTVNYLLRRPVVQQTSQFTFLKILIKTVSADEKPVAGQQIEIKRIHFNHLIRTKRSGYNVGVREIPRLLLGYLPFPQQLAQQRMRLGKYMRPAVTQPVNQSIANVGDHSPVLTQQLGIVGQAHLQKTPHKRHENLFKFKVGLQNQVVGMFKADQIEVNDGGVESVS